MYNTPEKNDLPGIAQRVQQHHVILLGDRELNQPGLMESVRKLQDTQIRTFAILDGNPDASQPGILARVRAVELGVEDWRIFKREMKIRLDVLLFIVFFLGLDRVTNFIQFVGTLLGIASP